MELDPQRNFSKRQKAEIWANADGWSGVWCGICGLRVNEGEPWDADHVVPWLQGGWTTVENGQVTHPACNRSKKDKFQKRDGGHAFTRRWGQEFSYDQY